MWMLMKILFLQVLIGLMVGFYFTDKNKGLSFREIQLGAVILLIVSSFFFLGQHSFAKLSMIFSAIASAIVFFGSILLGEWLYLRLLNRILHGIQKEQIHSSIQRLVEQAKLVACQQCQNKEKLDAELYRTIDYLKTASKRAHLLKQHNLAQQLEKLAELCVTLSRMSMQIRSQQEEFHEKYKDALDKLVTLSWETLIYTEHHIEKKMKKLNIIALAVKAVHMK